jgi:hypothetical protein
MAGESERQVIVFKVLRVGQVHRTLPAARAI